MFGEENKNNKKKTVSNGENRLFWPLQGWNFSKCNKGQKSLFSKKKNFSKQKN